MFPNQISSGVRALIEQAQAGIPFLSLIGLGALSLAGLVAIWFAITALLRLIRYIGDALSSRKRRQTRGYCIGVAPIAGRKGRAASKALIQSLKDELQHFSFGAPYEVVPTRAPRATRKLGMRDIARRWLSRTSAEVMVWGHQDGKSRAPIKLDILSCQGSLTPKEAQHSRFLLPAGFAKEAGPVRQAGVYLVARAMQPGLAYATAFRAERLVPVAEILAGILKEPGGLPEQTLLLLETDYCAMALHIGRESDVDDVIRLRRLRLAADGVLDTEAQIAARIDLGRALLAKSAKSFDPVRVREAMDHLKTAVELLRQNPTIQLATKTSNAVQSGQAMLANRQRFSVTGGSGI